MQYRANIGTRQKNCSKNKDIINTEHDEKEIISAVQLAENMQLKPLNNFGDGKSYDFFLNY